jgi:hypothetical protein
MSTLTTEIPDRNAGNIAVVNAPTQSANGERKGLTKKEIAADHPTWCPGCGDFSVLALYFKLIEKRKMWHEKITTVAASAAPAVFRISCRRTGRIIFTAARCRSRAAFRFRVLICTCLFSVAMAMLFPSAEIILTTPRARTSS